MTSPAPSASATADKTSNQFQEFGDRAAETGRQLGTLVLDTYEKTVASFVEFEHRAADAAQNELVKAAIVAHAGFIEDINGAYIKAMRDALPR
jgi:hypothetical protein